ncbi:MAG: hypothetical protein WAT30_04870 [Lactococcus raffinolactis]|mgnify:FL=1|jgi:hypothetical protein
MLNYLFIKNVKNDSDYKKSRLVGYVLTILAILASGIVGVMTTDNRSDFTLGFFTGLGVVIFGYSVLVFRELSNPEKLHIARIKATDERRKQLELKIWSQVGRAFTIIIAVLLILSIKQILTFSFQTLLIVLYTVLIYRAYRLRR